MTRLRFLTSGTALGLVFCATAAAADLTAADVWGDWRSYMQGMGYAVSATERSAEETLAVTGIEVEIAGGPDTERVVVSLGNLQFVENGDGTVDVVMPDTMPITLSVTPKAGGEAGTFALTYTQSGQRMTASGTPQEMAYDYTADAFAVALADVTVDGNSFGGDTARFALSGENLTSATTVAVGDARTYVQDIQFDNFVYDLFFKSPDGPEQLTLGSAAQSVEIQGTSTVPAERVADSENMNALLDAGFAFDGTISAAGGETKLDATSPEGTTRIKTGSTATSIGVAMSPTGLRYEVSSSDARIGAQLAGLPLPLFAQMAQSGFLLQSPVVKSEEPQDFALSFNLSEFTMSDVLWGFFDPQGALPRDPATVVLDLTGKAKLLFDFLDPQAAAAMQPGDVPGEIERVKINTLTVDAVGARLDATGEIALDNSDTTTLPGMPKPVGDISIRLAGANGLLDKLVALGVVQGDQAMGARMMLGLFAVPGDAPDTVRSDIVFSEDGQILANGQRIR